MRRRTTKKNNYLVKGRSGGGGGGGGTSQESAPLDAAAIDAISDARIYDRPTQGRDENGINAEERSILALYDSDYRVPIQNEAELVNRGLGNLQIVEYANRNDLDPSEVRALAKAALRRGIRGSTALELATRQNVFSSNIGFRTEDRVEIANSAILIPSGTAGRNPYAR